MIGYIIAFIIGYLIGSIPVGVLIGKRKDVDPREVGDHTPDAMNFRAHVGRGPFVAVLVLDTFKGLLAGLIGYAASGSDMALGGKAGVYVAVGGALVGHAFPAYVKFRGGKPFFPFIGGVLAITPLGWAAALEFFFVAWIATSFRTAVWLGVLSVPVWQYVVQPIGLGPPVAMAVLAALLGLGVLRARRMSGPSEKEVRAARAQRRAEAAADLAEEAEERFSKADEERAEGRRLAQEAERLAREAEGHARVAERYVEEERQEREPTDTEQRVSEAEETATDVRDRARELAGRGGGEG